MISLTKIKMNTVEKERQETPSQEYPDLKSGKETNPDLEKFNEQIAELTTKNIELVVCIYLFISA